MGLESSLGRLKQHPSQSIRGHKKFFRAYFFYLTVWSASIPKLKKKQNGSFLGCNFIYFTFGFEKCTILEVLVSLQEIIEFVLFYALIIEWPTCPHKNPGCAFFWTFYANILYLCFDFNMMPDCLNVFL